MTTLRLAAVLGRVAMERRGVCAAMRRSKRGLAGAGAPIVHASARFAPSSEFTTLSGHVCMHRTVCVRPLACSHAQITSAPSREGGAKTP